jgi:hypothetical protein
MYSPLKESSLFNAVRVDDKGGTIVCLMELIPDVKNRLLKANLNKQISLVSGGIIGIPCT